MSFAFPLFVLDFLLAHLHVILAPEQLVLAFQQQPSYGLTILDVDSIEP